jgi:hypothetical protein
MDATTTEASSDTSVAEAAPESAVPEASNDGSPSNDVAAETTVDANDAARTIDAAPDTGSCNPINGSCGGGGLTCNGGFSNCNASAADGCECATAACCGSACQTKHVACMLGANPASPCTDGTGQYFYDCIAAGTFDSTQATKACTAITGSAGACVPGTCMGGHSIICSAGAPGNCVCWEYAGSNAGRVYKSVNPNCYCPSATSPTWN